jgi:flagellin-like protein
MRHRYWRLGRRSTRGVSEIIATILLLAIMIVAGTILWTFRFYTPPHAPSVSIQYSSGGTNPVWGDPTDCQPLGVWTYPLAPSQDTAWGNAWWNQCEFFSEDDYPTPGNFTAMNTTEIIFHQLSANDIPLSEVNFTFLCNGNYAPAPYTEAATTVLLTGSLADMTWFPGVEGEAPANAPLLGDCGGFDMGAEAGAAFGNLFSRLVIFDPLHGASTYLENGDYLILYIHNGGWPLDYACIEGSAFAPEPPSQPWAGDASVCPPAAGHPNGIVGVPILDIDDYHGAPPWCFSSIAACTIDITYSGNPATLLGSIPVYDLTPPTGA